jgi:hypothetical protein
MAESPKQRPRHGGGKPVIELAGQQIGGVVVLERGEKPATRSFSTRTEAWWRCRCTACDAEVIMPSSRIRAGVWRCPCLRTAGRPGHSAGSSEPWPAPVTPPTRPKPPPMPPPQPPSPTPPSPGAQAPARSVQGQARERLPERDDAYPRNS